jgi:endonuclease YncB( thermonuclease family)
VRITTGAALAAALLLIGAISLSDDEPPSVTPAAGSPPAASTTSAPPEPAAPEVSEPVTAEPPEARPALLQAASGGDGDSWSDTSGHEYRLGLVNAPEAGECFGSEATAKRKALVAGGFLATTYETDSYGRNVAEVTLPDGTNLNVWLARNGYADARFLTEFRSERPALATELDGAFAAAERERLGLWAACSTARPQGIAAVPPATAPQQPAAAPEPPAAATGGSCHPAYRTCVPVAGNGSGQGQANDLDCGQIGYLVELRQPGTDPYRLDGNGDGAGCE